MHIKQNYTAKVLRVIDGDTILVQMDCPSCGDSKKMRIRLARLDAPDFPRHPKFIVRASTEFLRSLIESKDVVISLTQKWPDKYGRLIAEVRDGELNISNAMMAAGMGKLYLRRGREGLAGNVATDTESDL